MADNFTTIASPSTAAAGSGGPAAGLLRRAILVTAVVAGLAGASAFGYRYWKVGRFQVETDDAYVQADYSSIAPRVSGYIDRVLVRDNAQVRAGQELAIIDDRDYRTAVDQARAVVQAATAAVRNIEAQLALQQSVIQQEQASVAAVEASLPLAVDDDARYRRLIRTGVVPVQRAQQAETTLRETRALLRRNQAALVTARRKIDVLETRRGQALAEQKHSAALLHQAELNLSYTRIFAPIAGTVGARTLRVGQYVQAGTRLMAIVPLDALYVVANFKESQLTRVRSGQAVTLGVDSFPDLHIRGHVDSLSPASGLEFALLPPDNATGNFTKIVQRIPVKIVLDTTTAPGLLRAGMSVEPVIDTRPGRSRELAGRAQAAAATAMLRASGRGANGMSM